MKHRNEIGADGRKIGRRHMPCDPCRLRMNEIKRTYRIRRLKNGGRDYDTINSKGRHSKKWVGGHLLIDATGTRRRLQGLMALGYSASKLGARLGISAQALMQQVNIRKTVTRESYERTKALYDELSMIKPNRTPGERGNHVKRTQTLASRSGYVLPLAWDDESIDDPKAMPWGAKVEDMRRWVAYWATPEQKEEYAKAVAEKRVA
jgi:hypothetical protein